MATKSKILQLPKTLRNALDKRVRNSAYGSFVRHADWLQGVGHPISKSAVHRYARQLFKLDLKNKLAVAVLAPPRRQKAKPFVLNRNDPAAMTTADLYAELAQMAAHQHVIAKHLCERERLAQKVVTQVTPVRHPAKSDSTP